MWSSTVSNTLKWTSTSSSALRTRAWASAGAPIFALVAFVCVAALGLLAVFAQHQDRAFEENSRQLLASAVDGRISGVSDMVLDWAKWDTAYESITRRWDGAWVEENLYSEDLADLVLVVRDGQVRYAWTAEGVPNDAELVAEVFTRSFDATSSQLRATHAEFEIGGALAFVGTHPISRVDGNGPVRDSMVIVQLLDEAELIALGQSLGLEHLRLAGPTARDTVSLDVNGANLIWRHERPGSASFSTLALPALLLVLLAGACAWLVARAQVNKQIASASAQEAALQSSRMKSDFIASMSHELRTPLNAIVGFSELIGEEADDAGMAQISTDAARIRAAARHLTGLVGDILDQSKIDAGHLSLALEPLALSEVLIELEELARPLIVTNGNSLCVDRNANFPHVLADQGRLRQCLLNLVGNAAKFTSGGKITVTPRAGLIDGRPMVMIEVEDTGIGICPEELPQLFKPFTQANSNVQGRYGGAGLGLSISRKLARAMDGDITVRSEPGVGSTFTLVLPAAEADARPYQAAA